MKPTLAALNSCEQDAFVAALGHLFEHSPWVAAAAFAERPFRDLDQLYGALCRAVQGAPRERQLALIQAHPDLAGRRARAGELTAASAGEQAAAGMSLLTAAEAEEIQRLNTAYKARFGFPFIICARLNSRDTILAAMRVRAGNSHEAELSTALGEIAKIARLRLNDAITKEN
jgi:2-oxo-4-hydroxy-4-carboxy-5-ureidoimidazoline decarboxylase